MEKNLSNDSDALKIRLLNIPNRHFISEFQNPTK